MKPKKNETITGLDIGSYSVKCVEVVQNPGVIEVSRAEILPVVSANSLHDVIKKLNLDPSSHVRVALSGPSVIIRRISMPLLNPRELRGAIRFEAESHIPFSIDDCMLDYQVLKQDPLKKEMSILLAAVKRDLVNEKIKFLTDLGIHPEVIDLDIFCLINAFLALNPESDEKQFGLLNIGHRVSSFAILDEGLPVFVREIMSGGQGITKALSEIRVLSEEEAGLLKVNKPENAQTDLKAAAKAGFESLGEEIRQSIDYVENEMKGELKKVYVSGGGVLAAGALEVLAAEIGRPVSLWKDPGKVQLVAAEGSQWKEGGLVSFPVALGMTLRGLGGSQK